MLQLASLVLGIFVFLPSAHASDLSDFCGVISYSGPNVYLDVKTSVVLGVEPIKFTPGVNDDAPKAPTETRRFEIFSTKHMSVATLRSEVPSESTVCIRGWQDISNPFAILLYDYYFSEVEEVP